MEFKSTLEGTNLTTGNLIWQKARIDSIGLETQFILNKGFW